MNNKKHDQHGRNSVSAWVALCLFTCLLSCFWVGDARAQQSAFKSYKYGFEDTAPKQSGVGDLEMADTFRCLPDGSSEGTLFLNPTCEPETTGVTEAVVGVFSQVVCRVENLFGTVLGLVYCSVAAAILIPFIALLTLYVTIYGAVVLLGLQRVSFRNALRHVVKMALVAVMVLNSEIAIQVGYKFYIHAAQTVVGLVFEAFDQSGSEDPNGELARMKQAGYLANDGGPGSEADPSQTGRHKVAQYSHWLQHLDGTLHRIVNFFVDGGVGFIIVLIGLFIFMPALGAVVVYLIYSIVKALANAIVGYLKALLGITFLFTMAPIFVSFALFRATYDYFDAWLRHLAGFTLQMLMIFMLLMFIVAIDLVGLFQQIGSLIRSYSYHFSFGFIHVGIDVISLCRVERDGGDPYGREGAIKYYRFTLGGQPEGAASGNRYDGFPRCIPRYTFDQVKAGLGNTTADGRPGQDLPGFSSANRGEYEALLQAVIDDPEAYGFHEEDNLETTDDVINGLITQENNKLTYPFMELANALDIIAFLVVRLVAVCILTYLLDQFLRDVPRMAQKLSVGNIQVNTSSDQMANPHSLADLNPRFDHMKKHPDRNWAGGDYARLSYNNYLDTHQQSAFGASRSFRKSYREKYADRSWMRRHGAGALLSAGVGIGQGAANRAYRVSGLWHAADSAARDVAYRTLRRGAMLGRDPRLDHSVKSIRRMTISYGDHYYDAGVNTESNLGRRGGRYRRQRSELPTYGAGRGRHQRGGTPRPSPSSSDSGSG